MINSGKKVFIRKDKSVLDEIDIIPSKGSKTTAGVSIKEVILRDVELVEASEGKFRIEYSIIAIEDNIIMPLRNKSIAMEGLKVVMVNPWGLSPKELFCACLMARNGMTMLAIESATGISENEVRGAIRRSYEKSELHKNTIFNPAFILLYADYVLPISLIWIYPVKKGK